MHSIIAVLTLASVVSAKPVARSAQACQSSYNGKFGIIARNVGGAYHPQPHPPISQIADGQIQAPTGKVMPPVSQINDGQTRAITCYGGKCGSQPPISQIADGQLQAPAYSTGNYGPYPPVSQIMDGQIQAPGYPSTWVYPTPSPSSNNTCSKAGGCGMPSMPPVSQIGDGQIQAPACSGANCGGQPPVSQIWDGQIQAPVYSTSYSTSWTTRTYTPSCNSCSSTVSTTMKPSCSSKCSSMTTSSVVCSASSGSKCVSSSTSTMTKPVCSRKCSSSTSKSTKSSSSTSSKSTSTSSKTTSSTASKSTCTKSCSTQLPCCQSMTTNGHCLPCKPTATAPVSQIYDGQVQAPVTSTVLRHTKHSAAPQSAVHQLHNVPQVLPRQAAQSSCSANSLEMTLSNGVLKDKHGRTGYIADNFQFQFDAPPQAGAIIVSGFSVCGDLLALNGQTTWYKCRSGNFYNLYDRNWAPQCEPAVFKVAKPCS